MLSACKALLHDAVELLDVVLLFFLSQLRVELHEDGGIRVAHTRVFR